MCDIQTRQTDELFRFKGWKFLLANFASAAIEKRTNSVAPLNVERLTYKYYYLFSCQEMD